MKYTLLVFAILLITNNIVSAQVAFGIEGEGQFYVWQRSPSGNVTSRDEEWKFFGFPALGPKAWLGEGDVFSLSMEAKIGFSPFSLDENEYKGTGSVFFPMLVKVYFDPLFSGEEIKIGIGGGAQWSKVNLFNVPDIYQGIEEPFFVTYIGEISIGVLSDEVAMDFFLRGGKGPDDAGLFTIGAKLGLKSDWD